MHVQNGGNYNRLTYKKLQNVKWSSICNAVFMNLGITWENLNCLFSGHESSFSTYFLVSSKRSINHIAPISITSLYKFFRIILMKKCLTVFSSRLALVLKSLWNTQTKRKIQAAHAILKISWSKDHCKKDFSIYGSPYVGVTSIQFIFVPLLRMYRINHINFKMRRESCANQEEQDYQINKIKFSFNWNELLNNLRNGSASSNFAFISQDLLENLFSGI